MTSSLKEFISNSHTVSRFRTLHTKPADTAQEVQAPALVQAEDEAVAAEAVAVVEAAAVAAAVAEAIDFNLFIQTKSVTPY